MQRGMWFSANWAKGFEDVFNAFYDDMRAKEAARWRAASEGRGPAKEMNMASSKDFTVELEAEDKSEGEDVGTSAPAASWARVARISRRLSRKVSRTTAATAQRQEPNSDTEFSSWEE